VSFADAILLPAYRSGYSPV